MPGFDNPEMDLAFSYLSQTNEHLFITGKAGTGKTTFLGKILTSLQKNCVVVAPTGIAAINAKGVTIHSFFQLPLHPLMPKQVNWFLQQKPYSEPKINLFKNLDLLVIDEISMVRPDILDTIDATLKEVKKTSNPFGGIQLLMFGDLYQLPPVITKEIRPIIQSYYSSPYFFASHALREVGFISIELKKIYRQSDPKFIEILHQVRHNQVTASNLELLNQRLSKRSKKGYITLTTHNETADKINKAQLKKLKGPTHRFEASITDRFPQNAYPTQRKLALKVGAQVMFVKNDPTPERKYYNGKIGTITQIKADTILVRCAGITKPIEVHPIEWENQKFQLDKKGQSIQSEVVGTFRQFPLRLAWAITIHKSQGLTFEGVIIDAQSAFAPGQVYVALSRCKSLEGIILRSKLPRHAIKTDPIIEGFTQSIAWNLPRKKKKSIPKKLINDWWPKKGNPSI